MTGTVKYCPVCGGLLSEPPDPENSQAQCINCGPMILECLPIPKPPTKRHSKTHSKQ